MWKYIILFVIWFGVVFGQNVEPNSVSEVHTDSYDKNLSIEILGGKYFTFDDTIHLDSRTQLPFSMWWFGGRIAYQFAPYIVFSLTGGYSYAKNLTGIYFQLYSPPAFSFTNASFLVSYKNKISGDIFYLLGAGIDISYCRLFHSGKTLNTTYLSPIVSGSLQLNIASPLYLKVQGESKFYHLLKIGSEEIQQREIIPGVCLGLGYTFNLER